MSELKPCPSPVENAITVLKNEKQCVLRQIQIGGCDRNCVKCDLVMKDSEILAGYDTAVAVLRRAQPDHSGDATEMPANEPLTLEQLREMDGEPVWVTHKDGSGGRWGIVNSYKGTGMCADLDSYTAYWFDGWCGTIAYRRKPERSEQE